MFPVEIDGEEYRYSFLNGNSALSSHDTDHLVRESVRAYKGDQKRRKIRGEEFEGVLTEDKFVSIGQMVGQGYSAELEVEGRKDKMNIAVLITKRAEPVWN